MKSHRIQCPPGRERDMRTITGKGDANVGKQRLRKALADMRECDCDRRKEVQRRRRNTHAQ